MLKKNYLIEKLKSGKSVMGTWSVIPSVIVSDVIASSGVDFIIIDSEHGPINFETAQNMVIACESHGVSPVMRVGGTDEGDILRALDIGVHCLQVPNVRTSKDVEKIIKFAKYPPIGDRGFSPFTRAGNYSIEHSKDLTEYANNNVLLAVHIEGKEAIRNISEILSFKELNIVFIGLFDISKSLGIPGDVENPKVKSILKKLATEINNAGKYPGTIVNDIKKIKTFVDYGIKYITYSVDCEVINNSYSKICKYFKTINKGKK